LSFIKNIRILVMYLILFSPLLIGVTLFCVIQITTTISTNASNGSFHHKMQ